MTPLEGFLVGVLLLLALFPLYVLFRHERSRTFRLGALLVILAATSVPFAWGQIGARLSSYEPEESVTYRPIQEQSDGYVSSKTCQTCHPQEYATWHGSYHRAATQVATPETVLGRFDGVERTFQGQTFRPMRSGDTFLIEMYDAQPDRPTLVRARVAMVLGSHVTQDYLYSSEDGRTITFFPFSWRIPEEQWIPYNSAFLQPPDLPLESLTGTWNRVCINCHATHGKPRSWWRNDVDTRVGEFGVACEACHGPGEEHVRANHSRLRRYAAYSSDEPDQTIVQPQRLSTDLSMHVCAQCHGLGEIYDLDGFKEWNIHGMPYRPGDDLTATRFIVRPDRKETLEQPRMKEILQEEELYLEGRFWSDGMVRLASANYNGLINSPCVEGGEFTCFSCHALHQTDDDPRPMKEWANTSQMILGMDGNEACLQCHESYRSSSRLTEHTRHEADSTGSLCYNCHMPYTAYGLLMACRSHQVDSPTVAASLQTGRPNACNQCHLDKTLDWTNEYLAEWYNTPRAELDGIEKQVAASVLWALRGDAGQRVLMACSMGWAPARDASGPDWMPPYLAQLLVDPYDAVRFIAHRTLKGMEGFGDLEYNFVGSPQELAEGRRRALEIWKKGRIADGAGTDADPLERDAVLIGPDGALDLETFGRLLEQRDDRVVDLRE
jgi:hypothetical protein